jgi:3-oxoacyl-[acyl-carrier-protein] synthase-3
LPWQNQPEVAGLFGDGAGAAVVQLSPDAGLRAAHFATYPAAYDACQLGSGGTRFDFETDPEGFAAHSKFYMNGKELFRVAAQHFGSFVDELLAKAGCTQTDITCVIAHQASPGALEHMIRACRFDSAQVVNIVPEVGNQIAASIPFVLDHARKTGRIKRGDRIAMLGTSAGVSFGGLVLDL